MQEVERNFLLLFVAAIISLLVLQAGKVLAHNSIYFGSISLSDTVVREISTNNRDNRLFLSYQSPNYKKGQVLGSLRDNKDNYWKDVIDCESTWRHYDDNGNILVGDKHLPIQAYGIAQFQIRTFKWLKDLAGRPELNWKVKDDQIWLLRWAIDNGYGDLWTCY